MSGSLPERPLAGARVLVTGASGFLGQALLRALAPLEVELHALSRAGGRPDSGLIDFASDSTSPGGRAGFDDPRSADVGEFVRAPQERRTRRAGGGAAPPAAELRITWHRGDLTDPPSLAAATARARPTHVFHLAAYGTTYGERDRERAVAVNVQGSLALWKVLEGHDCRLVVAGTCGEYGLLQGPAREDRACAPTWFYPATKHAMVTLLTTLGRETGREVVALRPFGPYGPGDVSDRVIPAVVAKLLAGETVDTTAGEQLRDFLHVDDTARAFLLAATRALPATGAVYNVGSGECVSLRSVLEQVADAVGPGARERIRFGALPYRDSEVWEMCAATEAIRRDLGFEPRIGLTEGLAETVAWFRRRLEGTSS